MRRRPAGDGLRGRVTQGGDVSVGPAPRRRCVDAVLSPRAGGRGGGGAGRRVVRPGGRRVLPDRPHGGAGTAPRGGEPAGSHPGKGTRGAACDGNVILSFRRRGTGGGGSPSPPRWSCTSSCFRWRRSDGSGRKESRPKS